MIHEKGKIVGDDILKVDMFLNHQIDIGLLNEIGKEFKKRFADEGITKILTVEASGIGIACIAAQYFSVPVVFAKKSGSRNITGDVYTGEVYSFTKEKTYTIRVSKEFLNSDDKILIVDDFLANGKAVMGLMDIVSQAEAKVCGVGIVIEKGFQAGGNYLRSKGVRVESLAIIDSISNGKIIFR
jgi:xanthine phosphoribosyltransferase